MTEGAAAQGAVKERRYPCKGCGARLEFAPGSKALVCPYCGFVEQVPQSADEVDELSYEEFLRAPRKPLARLGKTCVRCEGCGASIETDALAQTCPFCGQPIVLEASPDDLIAPEAVLPFRRKRDEALSEVRKWLASRWFAPSDLKKLAASEGVRGVYIPFWTFDTFTRTFYAGARGDYYWTTESYATQENGQSVVRTRQVRHTRWSPAAGTVELWFDDVLVPALTSLPQGEMDRLEPWDMKALEPYKPEFLAGFLASRYEVDLRAGFAEAQRRMTPRIESACRADIGGDEQRLDTVRTAWQSITFKHVLLPVWIAAYQYRRKTWRVFVNARTGEVIGARPYSVAKIVAAVLVALAAAGAAYLLAR